MRQSCPKRSQHYYRGMVTHWVFVYIRAKLRGVTNLKRGTQDTRSQNTKRGGSDRRIFTFCIPLERLFWVNILRPMIFLIGAILKGTWALEVDWCIAWRWHVCFTQAWFWAKLTSEEGCSPQWRVDGCFSALASGECSPNHLVGEVVSLLVLVS